MKKALLASLACILSTTGSYTASYAETPPAATNKIQWQGWSDSVFQQAKKEHKFVVLDLEAVWCHWCHVMEEETYSNPNVIKLMKSKYIGIKVDQDSRPDLANRYLEYGWPATIFYAPDGTEIAKRAGFIEPEKMARLLQDIIDDPSPEQDDRAVDKSVTAFAKSPFLDEALRKELEAAHLEAYDSENGSWGTGVHKFLDWDSVEYSMIQAKAGDVTNEKMAKETLKAQINLLDPVWGGMYQYSTGGVWTNPHFEKIMSIQAENLRIYAQAYALWKDPSYLKTAQEIHRFLKTFLTSPEGAFYTSMDADVIQGKHSQEYFALDDAGRRKQGIPRIDKHSYSRENGWAIRGVLALYEATGDQTYLDDALKAANWVLANRSLPDGGFRHDASDAAGPYLGDTMAMGRAFLDLYLATGDRAWLTRSEAAATFIGNHFKNQNGNPGFITAALDPKSTIDKPRLLRDENTAMIRYANLLFQVSGDKQYRALAEDAMRYIATPEIAEQLFTASTLLPDWELTKAPTHITVVGHKDDPQAQALFQSALRYPSTYKRIDWWDKREGAMPNPDVQYPELEKPAAFICTDKRCSLPVFKPEALGPLVDRLTSSK